MLNCKKELFSLDPDVTYLNCAYMSPLMKKVEQVGHAMMGLKSRPYHIFSHHFFQVVSELKESFAHLTNIQDPERIAIIPSVSYGIATVVKNIPIQEGDEILMLSEQFPSNYYSWERVSKENKAPLITISKDDCTPFSSVNEKILNQISDKTKVIAMSHVHWADGTLFDLKAIREKADQFGAYVIVDGTQSVGALPFDVEELKPDALICAGYKWLMGPYGIGCAYYNERFDDGVPIEENWINRAKSENFSGLVNYQNGYHPKAWRYSVGEQSNMVSLPMLSTAIKQLIEWGPDQIQQYCKSITQVFIEEVKEMGMDVAEEGQRGHHLFGIRLPKGLEMETLKKVLEQKKVFVSIRGNAVRVAPHLYNDSSDFEVLKSCIKEIL